MRWDGTIPGTEASSKIGDGVTPKNERTTTSPVPARLPDSPLLLSPNRRGHSAARRGLLHPTARLSLLAGAPPRRSVPAAAPPSARRRSAPRHSSPGRRGSWLLRLRPLQSLATGRRGSWPPPTAHHRRQRRRAGRRRGRPAALPGGEETRRAGRGGGEARPARYRSGRRRGEPVGRRAAGRGEDEAVGASPGEEEERRGRCTTGRGGDTPPRRASPARPPERKAARIWSGGGADLVRQVQEATQSGSPEQRLPAREAAPEWRRRS